MTDTISVGIKDAGLRLGVSRTVVYELIRDGELPSFTIGKRRLVRVRDLADYTDRKVAMASRSA